MRAPLLAVLATALLVPAAAPAQTNDGDPDPKITSGEAQRALDAATARWDRAAIRNYRFRVKRSCFCPPPYTDARVVTVRNGVPVRAPEEVRSFASVKRLFKIVQGAIDGKVAALTVDYDAKLGFPRSIAIDVSRMIADEEGYYSADRLVRLKKRKTAR